MGRPLAKRFFGNRNIGTGGRQITGNLSNSQNYADDRIGGEGVASYNSIVAGTGWTTIPTVTFSVPDIPGGVGVAGTAHYKALSFATTANGSGYNIGDVLEVATGTADIKARAPVNAIVTISAVKSAGGSGYNDGDELTFSGAGWTTPLILRVNRPGGGTGTPDDFTILQNGVRSAAAPTNPVAYTSRTGSGNGCTVNIGWGVYSFGAVTVPGDYTLFPSTNSAGTLTSVTPATGTGAKADITMGLLSIAVTEKGSGYTSPADAAVGFSGSTGAAATAILTVDTGAVGSATNQENAIIIHANTSGGGSTGKIGDIIKQVSTRRYKVKTADGIKICELGTSATPASGKAYIVATATGGTYYVTKLTAHRARLVAKTGDGALDGKSVRWTFGSPTDVIVQIENA